MCADPLTIPRGNGAIVRDKDATEDHVRPRCRGHHRPYNTAFACYRCNNRKHESLPTACQVFFARQVWVAWDEMLGQPSGVRDLQVPVIGRRTKIRVTQMQRAYDAMFEGAQDAS